MNEKQGGSGLRGNRSSAPPLDMQECKQEELTPEEWSWVRVAVRHALRGLDWNDREYVRDEARQEAAIKVLSLRIQLTDRPEGERARYTVKSLGHHLRGWAKAELQQRTELDPPGDPESEGQAMDDLPDEGESGWEGRLARCLFEDIGDERLAAAFATLSQPQQEALNLHYFHGLCLREIAELLSTPEETVKNRCDAALLRLRKALGVHGGKGSAASPARRKNLPDRDLLS